MKQLNHSPEAAAAILGVSLKVAMERMADQRKNGFKRRADSSKPHLNINVFPVEARPQRSS